ncbi:protein kinase domain-containing protein [Sediminispirochaeta smaragdinae]|uniref:histidine kinase n=1 Tax=Sediminispirochaeta smaragdinae (strain DSM 11293 / JCM 15392 / SEBR 4228) TaxID=573413 RepID=E1R652_SEDSS|nr:ATP-binding protein [Sediminispirochaeta smaragdinae]ADK80817.1 multi-sensor signal transduction multi-kinase [Sediminispirochaeta smaragdinae DSM 11293]
MITLPGYTVERLAYRGNRTLLYRGFRDSDGSAVALKRPVNTADPVSRQRLREEQLILKQCIAPCFPTLIDYLEEEALLVLEWIEGSPLGQVVPREGFELKRWFDLALQIAKILTLLQEYEIVHRDITGSNLLLESATGRVVLVDFGRAFVFGRDEVIARGGIGSLESRVAYLSPEETGRLLRPIDYRSDFYSAGICLYELLIGRPPFVGNALELVYAHLARTPVEPKASSEAIPDAVSAIVMKLLAKMPEERYSSAQGLMNDLEEALELYRMGKNGRFVAGTRDPHAAFLLSGTLFGRDRELVSLGKAIDRSKGSGAELLLLAAETGMGKSALLREFVRLESAQTQSAWVVLGQWHGEEFGGSALIEAANDLIYRILGAHENEIAYWASIFRKELGDALPLLRRQIPALSLIVGAAGEQGELPEEGKTIEAIGLLSRAIGSLFHVVCSHCDGLVLVLDDLHYAPRWELEVLKNILTLEATKPMLVLSSYRPEEIDASSSLFTIFAKIPEDVRISTMLLHGLEEKAIGEWISESLGPSPHSYMPQAKIFAERFSGNPMHIAEALRHLHDSQGLVYRKGEGWSFDQQALEKLEGIESVRKLIFDFLDRLSPEALSLFALILCFGERVKESELDQLLPEVDILPLLENLYRLGFIKRSANGGWELSYPKLRKRFLRELPADLIEEKHLAIGRLLFSSYTADDGLSSLQRGISHILKADINRLSEMERRNIGEAALSISTAHLEAEECDTAMNMIDAAQQLIGAARITADDGLFSRYYGLRARCLFIRGNIAEAIGLFEDLIRREHDPVACLELYGELIDASTQLRRYDEAMANGRRAFALAGIDFPETENGIEPIVSDLPPVSSDKTNDKTMEAFSRMAVRLLSAIHETDYGLYISYIRVLTAYFSKHGGPPATSVLFMHAAALLIPEGRYLEAGRLALRALRVADVARDNRSMVLCREVYGFRIAPWILPLSDVSPILTEGFRIGRANGEGWFTGDILIAYLIHEFFLSSDLHELYQRSKEYGRIIRTLRNGSAGPLLDLFTSCLELFLAEEKEQQQRLLLSQEELFHSLIQDPDHKGWVLLFSFGSLYDLVFDDDTGFHFDEGQIRKRASYLQESYLFAPFLLAQALGYIKVGNLQKAAPAVDRLRSFESGCADNISHLRLMLEAELRSRESNSVEIANLYDEAIRGAQRQGDLFHCAVANELSGRYHARASREKVAGLYLLEAYRYWSYLGVRRKAEALRNEWGSLFPSFESSSDRTALPDFPREPGEIGLDAFTLLRAGRELTEELREEVLIERMLRVILESTGAQKAFLILVQDDELYLRARYLPEEDGFTLYPLTDEPGRRGRERLIQSINLSIGVLRYTRKRKEPVVLDDAAIRGIFTSDPYFRTAGVRSLLCYPLPDTVIGSGMLYLENDAVPGLFTPTRLEIVSILSKQAIISLQNARLYEHAKSLNRNLQEEILRRSQVEEGLLAAQKELKRLNEELEHRVEERTKDLRDSYQKLKEAQKQLIESEKLASLGSLVAGIAHEVNTPIGVAVTAATLLQDQIHAASLDIHDLEQTSDLILRNLKRAGELIGSFKQVAVDQASEALRSFDLRSYIEDIVLSLGPRLKKRPISVEVEVAQGITVIGYPGAISQIFTNLISNSLIHAYEADDTGRIRIDGFQREGRILIHYRDDGKGMDEESVRRVFEPFYTTRRGSGGSGLGMNIVYNLITGKLGGSVSCESTPGKGVLFTIDIPIAPPKLASSS